MPIAKAFFLAIIGLLVVGAVLLLLVGAVGILRRLLYPNRHPVCPTLTPDTHTDPLPESSAPEQIAAVIAAALYASGMCTPEDVLTIHVPQPETEAQRLWAMAGRLTMTERSVTHL